MDSARRVVLSPSNAPYYAAAAGVTAAELERFVASDAFAQVPIIRLDVSLLTRVMTAHATRPIREGDVTDVEAMATYLPYCNVYGTDRFIAGIARSLKVPEEYGCQLFDSSEAEVARLIVHLRGVLAGMAPVNSPGLSIFVAPAEDIKERSAALYHQLGGQARMAKNRRAVWVELFGFDDGAMPQYELRGVPGVPAPFYGLQDVVVTRCRPYDTRDTLLRACHAACRSSHFVFIDKFQELPDDFIMSALANARSGQSKVLGYEIHKRTQV